MKWTTARERHAREAEAGAVFRLGSRLPDQVCVLQTPDASIFDGDFVFGSDSWPMLSDLATLHGDRTLHFLVVDPDAGYFREHGESGGFSQSTDGGRHLYGENLYGVDRIGKPSSVGYAAQVVAIYGDSLQWGIWVERGFAGVVSSSSSDSLGHWALDHGPFLTIDDALSGFLETNLGSAGAEMAVRLRQSFG